MEAKHDFGARWFFQAQPLRPDGHPAVGADLEGGAHAPDKVPPRASGGRAQCGAVFFPGLRPGTVRRLAQFAMDFAGVVMRPQGVDVPVGDGDFGDLFTGEVRWQPALPELVFAFDFALGLGRGGVAQADVVELERPAQLREGGGIVGEKEAVVIDVELQGPPVGQEGGGQEVEVGEEEFALINLRAGEEPAAIVEQVEHREGVLGVREPAMGRGVQLPELPDAVALPAAHRSQHFLGRHGVGQVVGERPAADLGAVELEGVQAQGLGGDEAVGAGRRAGQPLGQEGQHGLGPGRGVIAAGAPRTPAWALLTGGSAPVGGGQGVEATAREAELVGGHSRLEGAVTEGGEHIADERRGMPMEELLMLFKDAQATRQSCPRRHSFRRASLRSPSSKNGGGDSGIPVLLSPKLVLFCSPRDSLQQGVVILRDCPLCAGSSSRPSPPVGEKGKKCAVIAEILTGFGVE